MRFGADIKKADMAGLLHDCAKYLTSTEKLDYAKEYGISVSEYERKNPELIHAKLGAYIAKDKYGIDDPEILSAITWHTTGKPDMTLLEKIIFIADFIEPGRFKAQNLDEIRALAFRDLDQCLLKILSDTVSYLETRNIVTDPMTKRTWEYYRDILS
jgi:predicted HD superfamily hydrolase involved in NAD metabolism